MAITTVSSREFNQDVSRIKRAAANGPVFITDRGQPSHVLLTIEDYQRITEEKESIVELLAMPDAADIDFEAPRLNTSVIPPGRLVLSIMYLLDTNVVSELRKAKSGKADVNVVAWASSVSSASLFISVITILELEIGVLLVERRDPAQGAVLRAWLNAHVLPAFSGRTLFVDTAVAQRCARLHVPDPKSDRDAIIAATALVHGMTIVSRNVEDYKLTGVIF